MAHSRSLPIKRLSKFNFATDVIDYWAQDSSLLALQWVDQSMSQERKFTFADISRQSHRIAKLFLQLDINPGDTVILILPRIPEWWEIVTACLRAGVIVCPCTTLLVANDIEYRIKVAHATVFIGDESAVGKAMKVKSTCPSLKAVIQVGGHAPTGATDFHDTLSKISKDTHFPVPNSLTTTSPALIFFTSGTTGPPKIVQHSQISYPLAHTLTGAHWLRLSPGKLFFNLSDQGWAKAAWAIFGAWNMGAALFTCDDRGAFSPTRLLELLHRYPITHMCAPPTAYRQLVLNEGRKYFESHPPKALEHCCGAGEPLNESVINIWQEMTGGIQIYDGYGQTEMILVCANQKVNPVKPGSMGKPIPQVPLVVIGENGRETPDDKEGDIAVVVEGEGQGMDFFGFFDGYIDRNTGKLDRKIKDGADGRRYFITGDRATRDKDGYFWFVGRSDDVINSSGYRIGPFEVESALKQHPSIIESAVVASPDPQRDEIVKAFIVLTESAFDSIQQGGSSSSHTAGDDNINDTPAAHALVRELQDFCKEHAAPYKYPRKIEFVRPEFMQEHKTISGKIRRGELKKLERERYRRAGGGGKL